MRLPDSKNAFKEFQKVLSGKCCAANRPPPALSARVAGKYLTKTSAKEQGGLARLPAQSRDDISLVFLVAL